MKNLSCFGHYDWDNKQCIRCNDKYCQRVNDRKMECDNNCRMCKYQSECDDFSQY